MLRQAPTRAFTVKFISKKDSLAVSKPIGSDTAISLLLSTGARVSEPRVEISAPGIGNSPDDDRLRVDSTRSARA